MRDVYVGRQPIFDRERRVAGWELLFRGPGGEPCVISDGTQATAQTVVRSIVEIGLDRVAPEGEPVYINCTLELLENPPPIPPGRCVLEVLEDIPLSDRLVAALDQLRARGYVIALDDFEYRPELAPLVQRADLVKVDVLAMTRERLADQVKSLRRFKVRLLAEKVDSEEQMAWCHHLGFELFQGYYLRRPDTLKARSVRASRLSGLVLMAECQKEDADIDRICSTLASDPGLSFKALQLANSALFETRYQIHSIPQAVTTIGLDALARWSVMLMLAGFENCPASYLRRALERARMCEILSFQARVPGQTAYLAGLLSMLESAIEVPIAELAPRLPIAPEIREALVEGTGGLGNLLKTVVAYESGSGPSIEMPLHLLERSFWDASEYAIAMTRTLAQSE